MVGNIHQINYKKFKKGNKMKKFIVGIMALAMVMVGSLAATAGANGWGYDQECTYAEGLQAQGIITGVAISDVSIYGGEALYLGGLSVDTIAFQGMMLETGAVNHGGICGSSLNLSQTISIETDALKINMTQTGVASSTRSCSRMEK